MRAYVPPPLPPQPPIDLAALIGQLERASTALGRLDGLTRVLPDVSLFLYMYVRKEAVLSSQIEGTQSSLSDLLLFEAEEAPGAPLNDVQEVSSYVAALEHGLARLRGGFPISSRLIREMHATLLAEGRGGDSDPGEFRRSQNWLGAARPHRAVYVPPPHLRVEACMAELERFIHSDAAGTPFLVKVGLVHVQFETIHPFLDGNGRIGRLLIALMLCDRGVLRAPMLYLSLFFKTHRPQYYELLQRVREAGDWEAWLEFFLTGIIETSEQAADTAGRCLTLFEQDRRRIESLGRAAASALRVHELLQSRPVIGIPAAEAALGLSAPTVGKAIRHLTDLEIVEEITGRQRGRTYVYRGFLDILNEGTAPLPR